MCFDSKCSDLFLIFEYIEYVLDHIFLELSKAYMEILLEMKLYLESCSPSIEFLLRA